MTDSNKDNDATVPADDHRDKTADAGGETPEQPVVNRVKIRNVTRRGTGIAIVGVHPPSTNKSSE